MKKTLAILLSTALLASLLAVCAFSVSAKTWEDGQTIDEEGYHVFDNAYGYVFNINYVDGTIAGEDATLITNAAAYDACNPNWAISVVLAATDTEDVYSVVKVVVTPGSPAAAGIVWADDTLVLVVHSASSKPEDGYANWQSKVAAVALKEGDTILLADGTATVANEDGSFTQAPEEDEPVAPPTTETVVKNIAEGKSYTISQLYRQGGAETEWGWDENAPIAYPDEDGKSLTDGVITAEGADLYDATWAGFHGKAPDYIENGYSSITIDLGSVESIKDVVLYAGSSALGNGISTPASVEVLVSNDGENFTSVNVVEPVDSADATVAAIAVDAAVEAQYVQVRMTSAGWMFVSEVAVNAEVEVETETPDSSDPSEDKTPSAGDASNAIVFAVIALVAVAGSAVVVKTRR